MYNMYYTSIIFNLFLFDYISFTMERKLFTLIYFVHGRGLARIRYYFNVNLMKRLATNPACVL